MKTRLTTIFILLLTAALAIFGILMPKFTSLYQNDALITQVEVDDIDQISFSYSSDNEIINVLQIFASGNYSINSDEREVSTEDNIWIKREASYFLECLQSYANEYFMLHGYVGSYNTINFSALLDEPYYFEPCTLVYNIDNEMLDNNENEQNGNSAVSGDTNVVLSANERAVWMVTTTNANKIFEDEYFTIYIDDATSKVCSFYLYDSTTSVDDYMNSVDINKYIYIFTSLFTEYYGLNVEYSQSDAYDYIDTIESDELQLYESELYYTITDPSDSDNYVSLIIYVNSNFVVFSLDSFYE